MKRTSWIPVLAMAMLTWAMGVQASEEDFPIISASDLKSRMSSGEKITLLNPLSDLEFQEQHIAGSVNIPLETIETTTLLPEDKQQLIVTYCLGPQ